MLFAKRDEARRSLASQFERHTAQKRYLALVVWAPTLAERPAPSGSGRRSRRSMRHSRATRSTGGESIVAADGQPARTRYPPAGVAAGYALAQAEPVTGARIRFARTSRRRGAPLVGDADLSASG